MAAARREIQVLGYMGVIPFLVLGFWPWGYPNHAELATRVLAAYAFGIICFLLGSWWGIALLRKDAGINILSNIVFIAGAAAMIFLPPPLWLLMAAILFLLLIAVERSLAMFKPQPAYYARLRLTLSLAASVGLLANYLAVI